MEITHIIVDNVKTKQLGYGHVQQTPENRLMNGHLVGSESEEDQVEVEKMGLMERSKRGKWKQIDWN